VKIYSGYRLLLLILAIGFPFFFIAGPGYYSTRSFKALWDLGHILFFGLASAGLCKFFSSRALAPRPMYIFLRVFTVVFLFGLMVELLQMFSGGRTPDVFDILRNQMGALIGCVVFCTIRSALKPLPLKLLWTGTLLLLLCFLLPLARAVIDEREAAARFPVLSDFETPFELSRWRDIHQLQVVKQPVRHGRRSMRVQLSTNKYSGTGLFYFPHDWSGYQWLNFSVYNPEDSRLTLHCRIHDRLHKEHGQVFSDRFHQRFDLDPGWNDLRVSLAEVRMSPSDREMDMHKIEGFGIFVVRQSRPLVIYLDYVYLSQ
jgi:VanZ family protein